MLTTYTIAISAYPFTTYFDSFPPPRPADKAPAEPERYNGDWGE